MSAACYFYATAPLLGISMVVPHIPEQSLQGDIQFLDILKQMNCTVDYDTSLKSFRVTGPKNCSYSGVTANLSSFSDQTMTLAVLAPFASTKTTITGISHIQYQECDRLHAILNELTKLGVSCKEIPDGIEIEPNHPHSGIIETYEDHRMAMAFSLIGLRTNGIIIKNAECCSKTFETYFEVLETMYQ